MSVCPTAHVIVLFSPRTSLVQISGDGSLEAGSLSPSPISTLSQNTPSPPRYKHHWFYGSIAQGFYSASNFLHFTH